MNAFVCSALVFTLAAALRASAAGNNVSPPPSGEPRSLPTEHVTAAPAASPARSPFVAPHAASSIGAVRIAETVNAVDTEDALKYLPSLFLRKRNNGDTQAVLATRAWGLSSSARSLVYADGVLLSALIANNNNIGAPRWGLVAPAEIQRIDVLYGPFSAAYAGNSMGAVVEITTRMPEKFEGTLQQTEAWQTFSQYGTTDSYFTNQTALSVGDRQGKFSYWLSANQQDSHSQPLTYVTNATFPAATTGGFAAKNKLGAAANVVGAGGLLDTRMNNGKAKLAYDFTPTLRVAYTLGLWRNDADSSVQTYLRDLAGVPTYKGLAGFASGYYHLIQRHSSHSLTFESDTKGGWDFSLAASLYHYDRDAQRSPAAAPAAGTTFAPAGKLAVLDGTGWTNLDFKAVWRPDGLDGAHVVSFGLHDDHYKLINPTFNTAEWTAGPATTVSSEGDGKTRTQAVWAQDSIRLTPALRLNLGLRYEDWHAYDGYNVSGTASVTQPRVNAANYSPKAVLSWQAAPGWNVTGSVAKAYRYATASELYQLVTVGATPTSPNPNLKPDDTLAAELRVEHVTEHGRVQLALFQDDVHNAIISQYLPLGSGFASYLSNVDHIRLRGLELSGEQRDLLAPGLDFAGSVTWLDARTLALTGGASATSPSPAASIGKRVPNVPEWRATAQLSYRPDDRWTLSVAGRYSGKLYTTLDNADVNPNVYQGFTSWFVADLRAHYRISDRWAASVGVDNVLNRKYFLFHPFPQRTFIADVSLKF